MEYKVIDDDQEKVVDSQAEVEEIEEEVVEVEEMEDFQEEIGAKDQKVADSEKSQSPKENSIYKKMRLRAEKEAEEKYNLKFQEIENERNEFAKLKQKEIDRNIEVNILDQYLTPENIENRAYSENVSEDIAKKLIIADAQKLINAERAKIYDRFLAINKQKDSLRNDEYFDLIEKEVSEIVDSNPNLDFETVYYFTIGQKRKELDKKLTQKTKQSVIADLSDKLRRRNINSDGGSNIDLIPSNVLDSKSLEICKGFGSDPKKIAQYVINARKRK